MEAVNVIYESTFDKMEVDHELTLVTFPMYEFRGDIILSRGKITLATKMGMTPLRAYNVMEFSAVDHHSNYHRLLGRSVLKELWTVTSI